MNPNQEVIWLTAVKEETGHRKRNKRKPVQEDAANQDSDATNICHLPIYGQEIHMDELVHCSMLGCGLTVCSFDIRAKIDGRLIDCAGSVPYFTQGS